jgi:Dpy-30 motif
MKVPFTEAIFHDVYHCFSSLFCPAPTCEPTRDIEEINNYLCAVIYPPLTNALCEMSKAKPDDPLQWLAHYMLANNNGKPTIRETSPKLLQHLLSANEERREEKSTTKC